MSYFAVIREAGSVWTDGKGIFEQAAVSDHAEFMSALADEGFILFGGPVAGTERGRVRALLIVDADDEADVQRRLAADPWVTSGQLRTVSIESWNPIVGAERIASTRHKTASSRSASDS